MKNFIKNPENSDSSTSDSSVVISADLVFEQKLGSGKTSDDKSSNEVIFRTELHEACYKADIEKVKELLAKGQSAMTTTFEEKETPLHYLFMNPASGDDDKIAIANILLGAGADINAQDSRGQSVAYPVIFQGNVELLEYLLSKNIKTDDKITHFAQYWLQNYKGGQVATKYDYYGEFPTQKISFDGYGDAEKQKNIENILRILQDKKLSEAGIGSSQNDSVNRLRRDEGVVAESETPKNSFCCSSLTNFVKEIFNCSKTR